MENVIATPFHAGELRAQRLAGTPTPPPGSVPIRDHLLEQHRAFFPLLPFLGLAVADADGWPVATLLQGAPGFVSAPSATLLAIASLPDEDDPTHARIAGGAPVGMLGIDLGTRRRNRVNGVIAERTAAGLTVEVRQSFGNCPRYIAVRRLHPVARARAPALVFDKVLPERARSMIVAARTLFVASAAAPGAAAPGAAAPAELDISHRGGPPGFVRVDRHVLTIPDYNGNRYYNTLGNLLVEPRAAIVLVDFENGDMLHLQGRVTIDWSAANAAQDPPAERSWRLQVARGLLRPGAFGLADEGGQSCATAAQPLC